MNGGNGDDVIVGEASPDPSGPGGNDTILGGAGNDALNGGDGNNLILGQDGADIVQGGAGPTTSTLAPVTTGSTRSTGWSTASTADPVMIRDRRTSDAVSPSCEAVDKLSFDPSDPGDFSDFGTDFPTDCGDGSSSGSGDSGDPSDPNNNFDGLAAPIDTGGSSATAPATSSAAFPSTPAARCCAFPVTRPRFATARPRFGSACRTPATRRR